MGIPTNKKLIAKEIFELNPSWIIELLIKRNDKKTENPGNKWYKKDSFYPFHYHSEPIPLFFAYW